MNNILCGFLSVFHRLVPAVQEISGEDCQDENAGMVLPFAILFLILAALFS